MLSNVLRGKNIFPLAFLKIQSSPASQSSPSAYFKINETPPGGLRVFYGEKMALNTQGFKYTGGVEFTDHFSVHVVLVFEVPPALEN